MKTASPGRILWVRMAEMASSSQSKGRARSSARCISLGTALCLMTAPSGARFPRSTAMVPFLPMGAPKLRMMSVRARPVLAR